MSYGIWFAHYAQYRRDVDDGANPEACKWGASHPGVLYELYEKLDQFGSVYDL